MSTILVIEDDPGVRRVLLHTLEYAGHQVRAVDNGRDALRALQDLEPDLVVTDIVMPDSDGLEIIRVLRSDHPGVRIIAISGGGMICRTTYLELAHLLGADVTLQKPILPSDLIFAVSELLASHAHRATPGALPGGGSR
ncbi:MAG: response regulator [Gemmatimonadales bacterium]